MELFYFLSLIQHGSVELAIILKASGSFGIILFPSAPY